MHTYTFLYKIVIEGRKPVPMLNPLSIHTHMLAYTSIHTHTLSHTHTGKEGREPVPMLNPLSPKPYLPTPRPTVQVSHTYIYA